MTGIVPKMAIRFTSYEQCVENHSSEREKSRSRDLQIQEVASEQRDRCSERAGDICWYVRRDIKITFMDHKRARHAEKLTHDFNSRSGSRCHRSRGSRHTHGSRQDPITSPTPFHVRSARCAQIPQRRSRYLSGDQRRRFRRSLQRCLPHSPAPGNKSSR